MATSQNYEDLCESLRPRFRENGNSLHHSDEEPPLVPERRCEKCISSSTELKNGLRVNGCYNIPEKEANSNNSAPVTNCEESLKNMTLSPEPPDKSPKDDMNGYFQANLHLLEYLSNDGRQEGGGGGGGHHQYDNASRVRYPNLRDRGNLESSDDEDYVQHNGVNADVNNLQPPDLDQMDDQGDFIETDIVPSAYDFLNSGSDCELSDEENQNRKDGMYEMLNLNHDRQKKEMDKIVERTPEEHSRQFNSQEPARRPMRMDIPEVHPQSISLWSPEIEYPELNQDRAMNIVSNSDACSDHDEEISFLPYHKQNNLNEGFSSEPSSDHEDELFNVSRQTSTSNFDNDENSFQGEDQDLVNVVDDEEEDSAVSAGPGYHHHYKRRCSDAAPDRGPYSQLLDAYEPSSDDEEVVKLLVEPVLTERLRCESDDLTSPQPGPSTTDETEQNETYEPHHQCEIRVPCTRKACKPPIPKVMVWSEYEAYISQVKQIGRSACGPTAVINVLKAFDIFCDKEKIKSAITTNLRAEKAPLPEYLLSRSVAGTTAGRLVDGIMKLTDGAIYGKFFCFYPKRKVDLTRWLGYWISKGAVPMVTLNLQKAVPPGWVTPDAWHHQMVYGVGPKGVYLTNPLEILPVPVIEQQLCSDSVLLVRRSDVASRWAEHCDLGSLVHGADRRWAELNVLGQVVSVLREASAPAFQGYKLPWTSHIRIPCVYESGVSLFVKSDSETYKLLHQADQLPLDEGTDNVKS